MHQIFETERLMLIPLNDRQLILLTENLPALEQELKCHYEGNPIENEFLDIVRDQQKRIGNDTSKYLYYTLWQMMEKESRVIIGSACFKGPPDKEGYVEVGYGLNPSYGKKGYMTEAVRELCSWAFTQDEVNGVIAETDKSNTASQMVLKRCGMSIHRGTRDELWWKVGRE